VASQGQSAVAEPEVDDVPEVEKTPEEKKKRKRQPRYHVVLWNDDDHSYEYVIEMMKDLFGHPVEKGFQIAKEVDKKGKSVCLTTTLEHAELKRDQIHAYGKDKLIARCKGSMSATVEAES
jgi:ATP-dependent Clp protease adaptor protein ClpS